MTAEEIGMLAGLTGSVQKQIDLIKLTTGSFGKLLYTGILRSTSENVSIPDLSMYNFFACQLVSRYLGGVALGIRFTDSNIRFVGITQANQTQNAMSFIVLHTNKDIVINIESVFGENAFGISQIYGMF